MSHLSDDLQEQYEDFRMLARRATQEKLDQPDWELNTQCVNIVKAVTDPSLLAEIAQMLQRRLREPQLRVVVLTLYLIDAMAHNCGHALLNAFNNETFMQQIGSVARKNYITPFEVAAAGATASQSPGLVSRHEAVCVCLELLSNWSQFFRAHRAYYTNIVDMYDILESEGITANASLSLTESIDVKGKSGVSTSRSNGHSFSDATTSATLLTSEHSNTSNSSNKNEKHDPPPRIDETEADYGTVVRPSESASLSSRSRLPRSRSKNGDEMHPKKVAASDVTLPFLDMNGNAHLSVEANENFGMYHSPALDPTAVMQERGRQSKDDTSSTGAGSISSGSCTRLSSSEYIGVGDGSRQILIADGKPPVSQRQTVNTSNNNVNNTTPVSHPKLCDIAECKEEEVEEDPAFGTNLEDSQDFLSPEDLKHHQALQSSLMSPSNRAKPQKIGGFEPPALQRKPSPRLPAQTALDEFLKKNARGGVEVDELLQEELLNQVEIERRIKNKRDKPSDERMLTHIMNISHGSNEKLREELLRQEEIEMQIKNQRGQPFNQQLPTHISNISNGSNENLQNELRQQVEIERSIKEQRLHRHNAYYGVTHNASQGVASPNYKVNRAYEHIPSGIDEQQLFEMQLQQQIEQEAGGAGYGGGVSGKHRKQGTLGNPLYSPSSDSEDYDGQLIPYADGNNKDFFFVGNTNSYIQTETPERSLRKQSKYQPQQQQYRMDPMAMMGAFPTQVLPPSNNIVNQQLNLYNASSSVSNTRSSSASTSVPTTSTKTTNTSKSSHFARERIQLNEDFEQQVEIQKQIFQQYEHEKKKHHRHRQHQKQELHAVTIDHMAEAESAKERLLSQQQALLSASVDQSDNTKHHRHRHGRSQRSKHDNSRAVDLLTRKSTADMTCHANALSIRIEEENEEVGMQASPANPRETLTPPEQRDRESRRDRDNSGGREANGNRAPLTSIPTVASARDAISPYRSISRERRNSTDSPIMGDTTASISAASAMRREKEKRKEREKEIELEWEREQERVMDMEKERERAVEVKRQQKKKVATDVSSSNNRSAAEAEHSFSAAAFSGREMSVQPSTGGFNPFANCPNNEIIIVKGGSAVSDLTCSTVSSDSEADGESGNKRVDLGQRHASAFEPVQTMAPLGMPMPQTPTNSSSASAAAAASALLSSQAGGASVDDPLMQSVALLLREALDPSVAASASPVPTIPISPVGSAGVPATVDRAKALAAARLLISTLLGEPGAAGEELVNTPTNTYSNTNTEKPPRSQQPSPGSDLTLQQSHSFHFSAEGTLNGPTDSSYGASVPVVTQPARSNGSNIAADLAPSPDVFMQQPSSYLTDDGDGLYSNYQSARSTCSSNPRSKTSGRPPVLLDVDTADLAELSSRRSSFDLISPAPSTSTSTKEPPPSDSHSSPSPRRPRMESLPANPAKMGYVLPSAITVPPPPSSISGVPPLSPSKSRKENIERPPHARKPSDSSQSRMRQSEKVRQTLEDVSSVAEKCSVNDASVHSEVSGRSTKQSYSAPEGQRNTVQYSPALLTPQTTLNTVALQSGISVMTEDTFETAEERRSRDKRRSMARSRLTRSSSVAAVEREATTAATDGSFERADHPRLTRSTSMDARPRKGINLVIDTEAPFIETFSRQTTPGSRKSSSEKFPGSPVSQVSNKPSPAHSSGIPVHPSTTRSSSSRRRETEFHTSSSSAAVTHSQSFDDGEYIRNTEKRDPIKDPESRRSSRSPRPSSERLPASPIRERSHSGSRRRARGESFNSEPVRVRERSVEPPNPVQSRDRDRGRGRSSAAAEGYRSRGASLEPSYSNTWTRSRSPRHALERSSRDISVDRSYQRTEREMAMDEELARQQRKDERRRRRKEAEAEAALLESNRVSTRKSSSSSRVIDDTNSKYSEGGFPREDSRSDNRRRYEDDGGSSAKYRHTESGYSRHEERSKRSSGNDLLKASFHRSDYDQRSEHTSNPSISQKDRGVDESGYRSSGHNNGISDREGHSISHREGRGADNGSIKYGDVIPGRSSSEKSRSHNPPLPVPAIRDTAREWDRDDGYRSSHSRSQSHINSSNNRSNNNVYRIDGGLELTEEEMTFISEGIHAPITPVGKAKSGQQDYYPRGSDERRRQAAASSNSNNLKYSAMGSTSHQYASAVDAQHHHSSSVKPHPDRHSSNSSGRDIEHRNVLDHRSKSSGNMRQTPLPPQHSMHRSSSQGAIPAHANSSSSAGKKAAGWWNCSICTLENPPSFLACDACGMVKGPT